MTLFLFVSLLLAATSARAQTGTIEGTVTDIETGEPLPDVNLQVEGTSQGAATDSTGSFMIRPLQPGQYPIVVSSVGYETLRREVNVRAGYTARITVRMSRSNEELSEIVVVGTDQSYSPDQTVTATKVPTDVMNTPQSVATVSEQMLEDQLAFTVSRALENVSGVDMTDGFGQTVDGFRIRGFQARDVYIDGIPETTANQIQQDMATVERIDVLKGPAAVTYGRAQPGGLVNIVTKDPLRTPSYDFELTGGSDLLRGTVDLTGPLNESGSVRYRLIGAVERTSSFREFMDGNTQVVAPSLAVDFTERIGLDVDLEYQRDTTPIDRGIPALGGRPASIDRSFSMSGPQQDREAQEVLGRYEFRFDATEHLSLYQRSRIAYSENEFVNVQPRSVDGNELVRSANKNINEDETYLALLEGVYDRSFLGVDHTILGGAEYRFDDTQFSFRLAESVPNLNLDNPDYGFDPVFPEERTGGGRVSPTQTYSLYLQDQINVTESITVLAGGRLDWAEVESFFESGGEVFTDEKTSSTEFSPRFGLVYRPIEQVSLFGNFTESFSPQSGVDAEGEPFDPEEGRQWEGGVKLQTQDGRLKATLAYFNIEKRNISVSDPTTQGASILIGEETSQGAEVDVTGSITQGWQVIANYSYKDAEISKDTNEDIVGNRMPNVAENRGRLWSTYEFQQGLLRGFKVGAGVTAVGERFADRNNTVDIPGYARVDASVGYAPPAYSFLDATVRVENVTDEDYYTSGVGFGANNIQVGDPLSVTAELRISL